MMGETRRCLIAGMVASVAFATAARAQPQDRPRRLGMLIGNRPDDPVIQGYITGFKQALASAGWREAENLRIDLRGAASDPVLYERYAGELVALAPDVIFAVGSPSIEALRHHSSTMPIVFAIVADPIGQGILKNLAHPDTNITGFTSMDPPMAGKWLEMLDQVNPPVRHVIVLVDPATTRLADQMLRIIEDAAPALRMAVRPVRVGEGDDLLAKVSTEAGEEHAGILVVPGSFMVGHRNELIALAARLRVPAVYPFEFFASAGGLMAYGVDLGDLWRRGAGYVARILDGAKPADLPVQRPTKFRLVVNLKTARTLGVTITRSLLAAADRVIE
jgi:putative tryptophan/tyrosine transport system substrate-binding protein